MQILRHTTIDSRRPPTGHGTIRKDGTVNREMSCLHHMFNKAVEWEMVERSPFDKGKPLRLRENNERLRFLSQEEIDRLLPECPRHLRRIVEYAIHTGMRQGEILKLEWSHIRNGQIFLEGWMTKTKEPRQIPINDDLAKVFWEIKKEQQLRSKYVFTYRKNEEKIRNREPNKGQKQLTRIGKTVQSVKTAFNSALKRAGIKNFRFHDLRHTFASHMIMKGATLKGVQEILGHKSMTMTMRYAHLSQEHKKKAVNLLNGLTASTKPADNECHKTVTFSESYLQSSS